jgi:hypothetical protein
MMLLPRAALARDGGQGSNSGSCRSPDARWQKSPSTRQIGPVFRGYFPVLGGVIPSPFYRSGITDSAKLLGNKL